MIDGNELVDFFNWCEQTDNVSNISNFDIIEIRNLGERYRGKQFSVEMINFLEWCTGQGLKVYNLEINEIFLLCDMYRDIQVERKN